METETMTAQSPVEIQILNGKMGEYTFEMVSVDEIYVEKPSKDEAFIQTLADSIKHIGLQNPITIVPNDIKGNEAKYRIVSGRNRLQAFVHLKLEKIPAHILTYEETDEHKDRRKELAKLEENTLRNHLSLIELCEHLGKCRDIYKKMYPQTGRGMAPKPKKGEKTPGTGVLPYALVGARLLGKSRSTIEKYLQIYNELIKNKSYMIKGLAKIHHPILERVEDLSKLASSEDLNYLYLTMCGKSDPSGKGKYCSLKEAQAILEKDKEKQKQKSKNKTKSKSKALPQPEPSSGTNRDLGKLDDSSKLDDSKTEDVDDDEIAEARKISIEEAMEIAKKDFFDITDVTINTIIFKELYGMGVDYKIEEFSDEHKLVATLKLYELNEE